MTFKELFWEYPNKNSSYEKIRDNRYMRVWTMVAIASISIGVFVSAWVGFFISVSEWDCNKFEKHTGIQTKYKSLTCYANYNGEWVEKQNIILTIEGKK